MDKIYPQKMKFLSARFRSFSPNGQNPSPFVFYKLDDQDIPIAESELEFIMNRGALKGLKNSLEAAQKNHENNKATAQYVRKFGNLPAAASKLKSACREKYLQTLKAALGFDVESFLVLNIDETSATDELLKQIHLLAREFNISLENSLTEILNRLNLLVEQQVELDAERQANLDAENNTPQNAPTAVADSDLDSSEALSELKSRIAHYYRTRQRLREFFVKRIAETTKQTVLLEASDLQSQIQLATQNLKNLQQKVQTLVAKRNEKYQQIETKWQTKIDELEATLPEETAKIAVKIKENPEGHLEEVLVNYIKAEKPSLSQAFAAVQFFREQEFFRNFVPNLEWLDGQIKRKINQIAEQIAKKEIEKKKKDLESKCQQEIEDEKTASQPKIEALQKQIKAATAKKEALELQKYEPDDPNSQIEQMINAPLLPPDFAEIEQNYRQQIAEQISANSG